MDMDRLGKFYEQDDAPLRRSYFELLTAALVNSASVLLSSMKDDMTNDHIRKLYAVFVIRCNLASRSAQSQNNKVKAFALFYAGIAHVLSQNIAEAEASLRAALEQDNDLKSRCAGVFANWSRMSMHKKQTKANRFVKILIRFSLNEPVQPDIRIAKCVSASIDEERYILKALNYKGSLYEDRIIQKEGVSCTKDGVEVPYVFDKINADKEVRSIQEQLFREMRVAHLSHA